MLRFSLSRREPIGDMPDAPALGNVVGDITHESGAKLHLTLAQCTSPAEAEFWAAIWPPAAEIICTFGHGFPV